MKIPKIKPQFGHVWSPSHCVNVMSVMRDVWCMQCIGDGRSACVFLKQG